jgi:hypothetical protein
MSDDLTSIRIAVVSIQKDLENTSHRAKNIEMKLDAFVLHRDLKPLESRIGDLEDSRDWIVKALVGAWIGGFATVISLLLNKL